MSNPAKSAERVNKANSHLFKAIGYLKGFRGGEQDIPKAIGHARRAVSLLLMVVFTK